jgi:hypothetical protein
MSNKVLFQRVSCPLRNAVHVTYSVLSDTAKSFLNEQEVHAARSQLNLSIADLNVLFLSQQL